MIYGILYGLGLGLLALVPFVAARALLTGLALPGWAGPGGRIAPLVASRSGEIGRRIGRLSLETFGPLRDLAVALGPDDIAEAVNRAFEQERVALLHRVASGQLGMLWRGLPGAAKVQFEDHLARSVPRAVDRAMAEIVEAIEDLIDIPDMQERYFGRRPDELSRMIASVALPGFRALTVVLPVLGALPLALPVFLPGLLPMVAGGVLGFGVGRLALDWMFLPPPARWSGRLPRRLVTPLLPERGVITALYADNVADACFRLDMVIDELVTGRGALATRAIVERRVAAIFARLPGRLLLSLVIPARAMQGMVDAATDELLALLRRAAREPALVARCADRLRGRVTARLDALDDMAFLAMQRQVMRKELPLLQGVVAAAFLVGGLAAALI